ncbi:stretch responsive protein [Capsaspora owczarzaki ATCC 30864]|uniref:stretch responsive protein n=1 Tax=Capsaspora owczarzaki (strain ATCC 30864) TaxID=595528 RepID=UPI0001FE2BB1|nr:stretch responsive protein [Capsaspora owczarzaki ATCC 30864]|eukprot:XP_004345277.1 stretch responsive protein [Capsaspora owczarzaki ATCC 30864]
MPQCWSSGDACLALFAGDGLHYPAVIARLASSKTHAYVVYAGFEDEKPAKVALTDLQPFASASQLVAEGDDPSTTKDQTAAEPAETTRARTTQSRQSQKRRAATINGYLRPYQRDGIQFLFERYRRGQGAILGDDMGLGKTIQVIGFVSALLGMTGLKRIDAFRSLHAKLKNSIPADLAPPAPHDSEPDPTSSSHMPPEYVPYNPTTEEPCFNELLDESKKGPVLIICPKAVLFNWKAEFEAWSYCKTAVCYGGTTRETAIADARARAVDVVITTYNICQNLGEEMDAVPWRCAIFDEVQKLKNPDAALSMALNRLKVRPRFGLTGTAVQNRLDEYWALLDFINKGSFGSLDQFRRLYDRPIKVGHRHDATMLELATGRRAVDNLNAEAKTFFLRRTKQLIAHQLPSKTEQIVFCHLTDLQEQAYSRLLASPELANLHESSLPCPCNKVPGKPRAQCCWVDDADHRVRRGTIFWCTTMLQKLSNHPALLIPDVCLEREAPISSRRHHTAAAAAQPGPTRGRKAAASTSSSKRAKRLDENEDDDAAAAAADHDGGELDNGDEEDTTNNNNDPFEDEEKELFQKLNDDEHIPTAIASKLTPYSANETAAAIERDMKDQAPWLVSEVGAYLDALNIPAPERQLLEALTARMHLKMIEAFQLNPLHDEHFPDDALEKRALKRFNVWRAVVCCQIAFSGDPRLLKTFLSNSPLAVTETADTSGKLKILLTLLQYYEANGDKVLIFCSSTRMLRIIEKIVMPRYNYLLLDGATSAMQRQVLVDKFQQDKSKFLFLISTRAGGVGLNLTAANVVIVFDPSWNPASDMQAQDRAFRIGQLRDVAVNRLMSQASIEEQIYGRQVYKQHLGNMALERAHERRMFTGIMGGSRSEHGDLFGAENLFAFDPEARKSSHLLARLRMAQSQALASAAPGEEDGEDAEGEVDDKVKRGAASAAQLKRGRPQSP